jgi:hypothetical protein
MKGFFFNKDTYLEWLDLDNKIRWFLESFKKVFGEQIINEVFIVKYENDIITPLYFFCAHLKCEKVEEVTPEIKKRVEKRKMEDFDFFVKNIISRQCVLDNECVIAKDQEWWLFDAIFRMENYYIWLNNTDSTFRELQEKIGMTEESFIQIVKNLYLELKK